jgi:uncharacterized linocin/CFP29 family protein
MSLQPLPPDGLRPDLVARLATAVNDAARQGLSARRFLDFEGPLGAGVTAIEVGSAIETEMVREPIATRIVAQRTLSVPMLFSKFRIPVRELLGARDQNLPLNTRPAADAGASIALAEERLIYHGHAKLGIHGLLGVPEASRLTLGDWAQPGQAIQDVISAADLLDAANVRQPFALALAPPLYNALFRKYEGSDVLQIDHIRRLAAGGVYKSLALASGAVLVSPDVGPLVCAQDIETHFLAPVDASLTFEVSEAIVLRLDEPRAVCVLEASGPREHR